MDIRLDPSKEMVAEIRFSGDGCAISMASASMLTQKLVGQPLSAVEKVNRDDVLQLVAIPLSPVRVKCALTGFTALGRALHGNSGSAEPAQA
jgi:nitrogen fixation NifU-like protein